MLFFTKAILLFAVRDAQCITRDRFRKERVKYKVSLMNGSSLILPRVQHKVVLVVLRTVFAVGF